MPRKSATADLEEIEDAGASAPTDAPQPVVFEPATDDEDEEEGQDAAPSSEDTGALNVAELLDQFAVLMAQREQQIWERLEERLATIVPPASNGHAKQESAEMAAPPGQHPDWMTMPSLETAPAPPSRPRRPRMVAFIPKEDPYNPKQTTFRTWINGREIRAKRGQVMILTMGHGIDLARNGHGNCVDIAAMQGSLGTSAAIDVPQQPDYTRPSDWDGQPLTSQSSVPVGR